MIINLIVATSLNRVIGAEGTIPWHLSADLKRVKNLTTGHVIIMGENTYNSIGKPLPNRKNVVMSLDETFNPPNVTVARSIEEALEACIGYSEAFVFGGEQIYKLLLPYVDRIYMTVVMEEFEGDTFFPELDLKDWEIEEIRQGEVDEKNPHKHQFITLVRG